MGGSPIGRLQDLSGARPRIHTPRGWARGAHVDNRCAEWPCRIEFPTAQRHWDLISHTGPAPGELARHSTPQGTAPLLGVGLSESRSGACPMCECALREGTEAKFTAQAFTPWPRGRRAVRGACEQVGWCQAGGLAEPLWATCACPFLPAHARVRMLFARAPGPSGRMSLCSTHCLLRNFKEGHRAQTKSQLPRIAPTPTYPPPCVAPHLELQSLRCP